MCSCGPKTTGLKNDSSRSGDRAAGSFETPDQRQREAIRRSAIVAAKEERVDVESAPGKHKGFLSEKRG